MSGDRGGEHPRACPRAGRTRAADLARGATRPSDALTAFLAIGVGWIAAAALTGALAALTGDPDLRWLALHLAFLGGVSQLVIGAAQFFACAFLATEPPSRATVRLELVLWNVAVIAIAVGVPRGITALTGLGGTLVLVALAVFALALRQMRVRSLQRAPWATRWYLTAALFLACGAALGPLMTSDVIWLNGSLLGAHLALNIGGWFGTAIVGTLHTFYPSLTGTRLRWPRLQMPTYLAWSAGVAALAASAAFASDAGATLGWAMLLAGIAMLDANLIASARSGAVRSPGALIVSAGQVLLVASIALGLRSSIDAGPLAALLGPDRSAVAALMIGGWIALTVAGSLLHLLTVMERVRLLPERREQSGFGRAPVAGAGIAALGLLVVATGSSGRLGYVLIGIGYAALFVPVLVLAARAVRAAPLRV